MVSLSLSEINDLQTGVAIGVQVLGYHIKGDTPDPIIYYLSTTTAPDDGGSVINVGNLKMEHNFGGEVNVRYFGAKLDTITDDSKSYINAIDYLRNRNAPGKFIQPVGGSYVTEEIMFNLPNSSTFIFDGEFILGPQAEIVIGCLKKKGDSEEATYNRNAYSIEGAGLAAYRPNGIFDSELCCIKVVDLHSSKGTFKKTYGSKYGIMFYSNFGNGGLSYNTFVLGFHHDSKINVILKAEGGYVNENIFIGGTFNHTSTFPGGAETRNIMVCHHAINVLNNNRFICPSLEDNHKEAVAVEMNGESNLIMHPRLENGNNTANYKINFTEKSLRCQILGNGFNVNSSNIQDDGLSSYQTITGEVAKNASSYPTLDLQNASSSNNNTLISRDSQKVMTFALDGIGNIKTKGDINYFGNLLLEDSENGIYRGVFRGSGTPSLDALPGSIYLNRAGGKGQSMFSKTSNTDGTGWESVPTKAAAVPDSTATTISELVQDYNNLLSKLRASGVISS
ncbi:hypothetical protein IW16_25330 [Chryseobacterium vrystaatense]|uniref:Pectate lyase superfamily protein n=2 Tax=Chryseobacterium vrystaatense TaxID=307480 RepID=A0ABR4UGC4_9FLAO|nr:hypothetical protein IW16_25330 [Chryseobacterium vrystaatense]